MIWIGAGCNCFSFRVSPISFSLSLFIHTTNMGILSWWGGKKEAPSSSGSKPTQKPVPKDKPLPQQSEVPGMNGAVEVIRSGAPPPDVTVFEFGSVATSTDKVTLAGYCPVSDELEPCRWEILPASGDDAPQFRVVFWEGAKNATEDCKKFRRPCYEFDWVKSKMFFFLE